MGYFSNGTEGDMYQERYCSRCIHGENDECPVWDAHLLYNGDGLLHQELLDMLIPQTTSGNGQCLMFVKSQPREYATPAEWAKGVAATFWTSNAAKRNEAQAGQEGGE